MSLSKEDMALEALIKLVLEINQLGIYQHYDIASLDYAVESLNANGWEVIDLGFGRFKAVKIGDAEKA